MSQEQELGQHHAAHQTLATNVIHHHNTSSDMMIIGSTMSYQSDRLVELTDKFLSSINLERGQIRQGSISRIRSNRLVMDDGFEVPQSMPPPVNSPENSSNPCQASSSSQSSSEHHSIISKSSPTSSVDQSTSTSSYTGSEPPPIPPKMKSSSSSNGSSSSLSSSASSSQSHNQIRRPSNGQTIQEKPPPLPPKTKPPPLPPKSFHFKKQSSSGTLGITTNSHTLGVPLNKNRRSSANSIAPGANRSSTTSVGTNPDSSITDASVVGRESWTMRPRSNDSVMPRRPSYCASGHSYSSHCVNTPLLELDVRKYLIYKSPDEDGPEIKGGPADGLLVKATEVTKNDFLFDEAFLTTYRTFMTPKEVVDKLLYRYNKFIHSTDVHGSKAATNSFSLLVRVVDELCVTDCTQDLLNSVFEFVYQLVTQGQLPLARALRVKILDKMETRTKMLTSTPIILPSLAISTKVRTIFDFKSDSIAEQITLLDSNLLSKIEVAEFLLCSKGDGTLKNSELTPSINKFIEHFNHFAYWVRSIILLEEDAKNREKLFFKFIKIMRQLKKVNNFNSIVAITSALESAPLHRLWSKNLIDALKEFFPFYNPESNYRAYRNILQHAEPPLVPYLGLTLQDLRFIQDGNKDLLPDGSVNFTKRWLQFEVLDQLRKIRNSHYNLTRDEEIMSFFNNFDDYLDEESMWQISESLKPKGKK